MRRFGHRLLAIGLAALIGALGSFLPSAAQAQRAADSLPPPQAPSGHKKIPAVAVTLAIIPGAGHVYAGEVGRGLTVLGGLAGVSFMTALISVGDCPGDASDTADGESCENENVLVAGGLVMLGIWGWSIVDAGMAANRANRRQMQAAKVALRARETVTLGLSRRPTLGGGSARALNVGIRLTVR